MNPMVAEVNKIVYNLLAGEHAVQMPSVGSLLVERVPAKRLSKKRIVPPYYAVIFTSHAVGTSLVDAIVKVLGCDATVALDVYERWLGHTLQDGVLTLEGIGVLRQKSFAVDSAFDKAINLRERTPMAVRPAESHWFFWTFSSVAILCGIGACGWILYDRAARERLPEPLELRTITVASHGTEMPMLTDSSALVVPDSTIGNGAVDSVEGVAEGMQTSAEIAPALRQQQDAVQANIAGTLTAERTVQGRSYVVLGVFSTEDNARRAAKEAMESDPSLRCGVWNYGNKFMASFFDSNDAGACAEFVRAHSDRYPEVWCYTVR